MNRRRIKKMYEKLARIEESRLTGREINDLKTERYLHRIEAIRKLPPLLRSASPLSRNSEKYVRLKGHVFRADLITTAKWFGQANRSVEHSTLLNGTVKVSTVFLSFNHRLWGEGPPVLWETMIFGGEHDGYQVRHHDEYAARERHHEAVDLVLGKRKSAKSTESPQAS